MRLRPDALLLVFLTLLLCIAHPRHSTAQGQTIDAHPGSPAVARALETVKADPNLTASRKSRILLWRGNREAQTPSTPAWALLVARLARWVAESGRFLIWVMAIVAALLLAAYLLRTTWNQADAQTERLSPLTPTHVRELDIRPESLPADIGAAAQILWEHGDRRAAIGLLYRGLLSRLVHRYRVPIRDSSTEGDCLQLARATAPALSAEYASRLVLVWQRFVYGQLTPEDANVSRLCAEFEVFLGGGPTVASVRGERAV